MSSYSFCYYPALSCHSSLSALIMFSFCACQQLTTETIFSTVVHEVKTETWTIAFKSVNKLQYWCQTTWFCGSGRHYQGEGLKFKFLAILYGCRKLFGTLYDVQEKHDVEDESRSLSAWRRNCSWFWFCRRHFGIFNQAAAVWIGFQVWNKWKNAALIR